MPIDWEFIISKGVLQQIAAGLWLTVIMSISCCVGALLFGALGALLQLSTSKWLRSIGQSYVTIFRNIPLLVVLFFFYFGVPTLAQPRQLPILYSGSYETNIAILVISLVSGAYMAEVIRAGIEAVPGGQIEAALASGINKRQTFQHIIVPQLAPIILPGMASEVINVTKSTAFSMAIGVKELTSQGQQIESATFKGFEAMTAVTLTYLVLNGAIFAIMTALERSFGKK
ncbi:MAG TPA: amino acid ABC transporter permease [bacterium]|nr:amino acid ABC transporter permease [bacterium]